MKGLLAVVVSVVAVAAAAGPVAAKVNLSGALWVTYWAQRQAGNVHYQVSDGAVWQDGPQTGQVASRKTFLLAQNRSGTGVRASAVRGNGLVLGADCPVGDALRVYGEFNSTGGAFALNYAYAEVALPGGLMLTAGQIDVPFGNEWTVRPGVGCTDDEVFISEFTQAAGSALLPATEVGVALGGTAAGELVEYSLYCLNGSLPSAADSAGVTGWVTPDNNDAKSVGCQVRVTPFAGTYLLGSFIAGDYNNNFTASPTKYTASGLGLGSNVLPGWRLSGEWATTRHDRLMPDFGMGLTPPSGELVAARVNEYLVKAIYAGIDSWEFGLRYGVVDPKNIAAEADAGYAREQKITFGVRYEFASCALLKAEYSRLLTGLEHFDRYSAARLGAGTSVAASNDPEDDIVAVQLAVQF